MDSNGGLADAIELACFLEATARKPGNVHPFAAFDDVCYADFVKSAKVVAPILSRASEIGVGEAVFLAAEATRQTVGANTNLGILLLIAPLAAVPMDRPLADGLPTVLDSLTVADAVSVYRAIRLASPGGLGKTKRGDVQADPTGTLREMMKLAADRDRIAAEYTAGFPIVLNEAVPLLIEHWRDGWGWETAVLRLHLHLMALHPDTLIARKCGRQTAEESAQRAAEVLDAGWPETPTSRDRFKKLDNWLRADGHQRNPGTTADLVAAALFAGLREQAISRPCSIARVNDRRG